MEDERGGEIEKEGGRGREREKGEGKEWAMVSTFQSGYATVEIGRTVQSIRVAYIDSGCISDEKTNGGVRV